jgi:hypothetical protein
LALVHPEYFLVSQGAWLCLAEFVDSYPAYKDAVQQMLNSPPPEVRWHAAVTILLIKKVGVRFAASAGSW